eukprot:NODE_2699_length_653_cov_82.319536_g2226_i0.p2 GENE.NODE_2699_length_653_cov_82.319536_g2226_i0~~NODE_2699_length_653_cov_82.319536_g2226_i0.p2  ORF type:complete len:120 (-),score=40.07 NODE_2699_length_653_cov_82.319536_g2226_i0:235-594(-)
MAFKSDKVFAEIKGRINADACEKVGVVFQFDITNGAGATKSWSVDAKNSPGSVKEGANAEATCTIVIGDDEYLQLITGELDGMQAFMQGKMKIKGNMMQAMQLEGLVDQDEAKAMVAKL